MTLRHVGIICICTGLAVATVAPPLLRGAGSPAAGAATAPPAPSAEELLKTVGSLDERISNIMPTPKLLADPDYRAGDGQKALPLLRQAVSTMADLEKAVQADTRLKDAQDLVDEVHTGRYHAMAYAATLGDKDIVDTLQAQAKENTKDGMTAHAALLLSQWLLSSKDAAGQQKVLDEFTALAKQDPENIEVLSTLAVMINLGPATPAIEKKTIEVIRTNMKGPAANELLVQLDGEQQQKAMVGQPLALVGRTSTGATFDTASLKGKVVMLDFWATWCGPCIQELPHVKAAYDAYHNKGFEIVGLSCDTNDEVLNNFTHDKDMPWVQLRESSQTEADRWHPLAKKYHVDGIPQMFLIDRNGILRYVDAREDLSKKVALLLAEPTASQPAPKP